MKAVFIFGLFALCAFALEVPKLPKVSPFFKPKTRRAHPVAFEIPKLPELKILRGDPSLDTFTPAELPCAFSVDYDLESSTLNVKGTMYLAGDHSRTTYKTEYEGMEVKMTDIVRADITDDDEVCSITTMRMEDYEYYTCQYKFINPATSKPTAVLYREILTSEYPYASIIEDHPWNDEITCDLYQCDANSCDGAEYQFCVDENDHIVGFSTAESKLTFSDYEMGATADDFTVDEKYGGCEAVKEIYEEPEPVPEECDFSAGSSSVESSVSSVSSIHTSSSSSIHTSSSSSIHTSSSSGIHSSSSIHTSSSHTSGSGVVNWFTPSELPCAFSADFKMYRADEDDDDYYMKGNVYFAGNHSCLTYKMTVGSTEMKYKEIVRADITDKDGHACYIQAVHTEYEGEGTYTCNYQFFDPEYSLPRAEYYRQLLTMPLPYDTVTKKYKWTDDITCDRYQCINSCGVYQTDFCVDGDGHIAGFVSDPYKFALEDYEKGASEDDFSVDEKYEGCEEEKKIYEEPKPVPKDCEFGGGSESSSKSDSSAASTISVFTSVVVALMMVALLF